MMPMSHLSDADVVDLLDNCAGAAPQAHAAGCPSCAARVAELRHVRRLVESDEAAEPSPLFWPQAAARVAEAVRGEAETQREWRVWRCLAVAAPALVVALAVAVVWRPESAPLPEFSETAVAVGPAAGAEQGVADAALAEGGVDESWERLAMLSESVAADEEGAPVFEPELGTADRALRQLTLDEQERLIRLLDEAMGDDHETRKHSGGSRGGSPSGGGDAGVAGRRGRAGPGAEEAGAADGAGRGAAPLRGVHDQAGAADAGAER